MKLSTCSALALATAFLAVPAAAQYGGSTGALQSTRPPTEQSQAKPDQTNSAKSGQSQPRKLRPSAKAIKPLSELQAAIKSGDAAAIQAKLTAAQAVVSTNEDRAVLAELQLERAAAINDTAGAMAAMDAILATGVLRPEESTALLKNLSNLRFEAKQYDKAAATSERRLQLNANDVDAIALLAESRAAQGRIAEAITALQRGIQVQSAAGHKPDEKWLKRATSLAYNAKLPNAPELARQWVAAYPSPTSWRNAIGIYRNTVHPDTEGVLDLLRLENAVGALTEPSDYALYASGVSQQGNYVEALAILNQGAAARHIDPAGADFRDMFAAVKAKPQATEADLAEAAKSAPAASTLIRIGDRYYGLGNYAKAAETYRAAMAKPGADANVGNLHLGMALARSGDKAGAAAAFGKVGGTYAEIAKYWLLYVQHPA